MHFIPGSATIDYKEGLTLYVPERPLAVGSVALHSTNAYVNLTHAQKLASFHFIQNIIAVWEKRGINDYYIYLKGDKNSYHWEIVPYTKTWLPFWQRFKVLWNIIFGASKQSLEKREALAARLKKEIDPFSISETEAKENAAGCAFCKPEVIKRQQISSNESTHLLFNYKPITENHFLITPTRHVRKFSQLKEAEYINAFKFAQDLITAYSKEHPNFYLLNANGVIAGQTVPHWHQHLVFVASKSEDIWGKLRVFGKMLFNPTPLSDAKLAEKIETIRKKEIIKRGE
jgi:diadenosine tetraphosphate (Ap4A) HIT family hydrolase